MNEKILLVDDEPNLVKLVAKRLEIEGYNVAIARDGAEALQKVESEKPELVILDIMLPKLNGLDVCRQIRTDDRLKAMPVMLFTAKTLAKDEALGFQAGADAYIRKPFRAPELLAEIRKLLDRKSTAS